MSEVQPGILALVGVTVGIGLLTFVIVTTTAFMKIAVVLFLVRNALGTQQIPPNMVLYGAALILTVYVSSPVAERVFERASEPHLTYATVADWIEAGRRAVARVAVLPLDGECRRGGGDEGSGQERLPAVHREVSGSGPSKCWR